MASQGVSPNFSCVRRTFASSLRRLAILAFSCALFAMGIGCATMNPVHSTQQPAAQVAISPNLITLAPGAHHRFTATVSGTSKTAVSWSASAGSIARDGTFTAPALQDGTQIRISASFAGSTQTAVSVVTVQSVPALAITTSALSEAVINTAYDSSLSASGGTPPYLWTISAGSLAPGFQLQAATGVLTGTTTKAGEYSFTAKVSDAMSHSATQNLILAVSSTGVVGLCGAPNYCSTTSIENPGNISALFTGTEGVNQTAYDKTYNPAPLDCYTRATDAVTFGGVSTDNNTYSGGDNDVMWSATGTYVGVEQGGAVYILHLDLSGICGQVVNTGNITGAGGIHTAGGPFGFSKVQDNVFYNLHSLTQIYKYTITSDTTTTNTLVADIADGTTCPGLPFPFGATHAGIMGIAAGDQRFGFVLSNTGGQGTGLWGVVYDVTLGCAVINYGTYDAGTNPLGGSYWNFCSGSCGPSTAPTGTLETFSACTGGGDCSCWGGPSHDSQMSGDGTALVITETGTWTQGACAGRGYATMLSTWTVGTATTQFCDSAPGTGVGGQFCGGHDTIGYSHMLQQTNGDNPGAGTIRSLSNTLTHFQFQIGQHNGEGAHGSWPNPQNLDNYPWIEASYDVTTSQGTGCALGSAYCPQNLKNAIFAEYPTVAYSPGQARTIFGHTFSCNSTNATYGQCSGSGDSYFACSNAIMSVSQDGNWAMIASGMLLSLGTDSKGYPRCDTFIVHLR